MSQNMKTLLPNTKFYNFCRKFWQVTALSWTFWGGGAKGGEGGAEISLGAPPLETPCLRERECRMQAVWKVAIFVQYLAFVSEMIQHRVLWNANRNSYALCRMVLCISNDFERLRTQILRSRHYLTLNVLETVRILTYALLKGVISNDLEWLNLSGYI